jgi:hypothetical protein
VGRHVYTQTVVSVSLHYKNPTKHVGLVQMNLIIISLKICWVGVKQQSLTHSISKVGSWFYFKPTSIKTKKVYVKFTVLGIVFIVQAHWNNSLRIDMSPHSDTLSRFPANHSLLFLLNAACLVEKQHRCDPLEMEMFPFK